MIKELLFKIEQYYKRFRYGYLHCVVADTTFGLVIHGCHKSLNDARNRCKEMDINVEKHRDLYPTGFYTIRRYKLP